MVRLEGILPSLYAAVAHARSDSVCARDTHHIGCYLCYMSKLLLDQLKEQLVAVTVTLPVCFSLSGSRDRHHANATSTYMINNDSMMKKCIIIISITVT